MREILFRGKTLSSKQWIEGSLLINSEGRCYIGTYLEMKDKTKVTISSRQQGKTTEFYKCMGYAEVDPKTIGQFTGKYDSNNVKVFEDDIVQFDDGYYAEVLWDEEDAMFIIDGGDVSDIYENFGTVDPESIIVVSNIFDNPELIKGGGSDE